MIPKDSIIAFNLSFPSERPEPPPISGNIPVNTNFLLLRAPCAAPLTPGLV
jgi:hypothetical protein